MATNPGKINLLTTRTNLIDIVQIDEGVYMFEVKALKVNLDKPIFIGAICLEYAKMCMVESFYKIFVPHFGRESISVMYTDTDSLIMEIGKLYTL